MVASDRQAAGLVSLLDNGPDTLLVYPEVHGDDGYGTPMRVPSNVPVVVIGRFQPVSAEESQAAGQAVGTVYKFIARDFPGGAWARVATQGRDWDVVGEPQRHNGSPATRHSTVMLRARTPAGP